jgi:signal transduction histidine kinase
VRSALRSLWAEPRSPNPPERVWRDWVLVGVLVPTAVAEAVFREHLEWRPVALLLALVAVVSLLWRRTHPLLVVVIAFGSGVVVGSLLPMMAADEPVGLYTAVCLLLLPYSLFRWGSGREMAIGLVILVVAYVVGVSADFTGVGDAVAAAVVLLFPAALGADIRYLTKVRQRELEQVTMREREQLARELHDTVAHHVSAIAVRAQAGRVVAATDPRAAVDALLVIENEASRTLTEMRAMVRVLREGDEPDLAPQRGIGDIEGLARAGVPNVEVSMSGDLDGLRPSVGAAVYRIAQESITNALQHARSATHIQVCIEGEGDHVRLTVRDDGEPNAAGWGSDGYGLVGMTERATLLGGTLEAGPSREGGWTVNAVLPRAGSVA